MTISLPDFKPFVGQHCETTTTGTLLNQIGIELSEPMLFGLGEGLGYLYFNMKLMDHPFIGGRAKTGEITANLCRNLNLNLVCKETTSIKKAWQNVADPLQRGQAVGLQLDCYHLEYFGNRIHFAGHFAALIGYDDTTAYLVDTAPQGTRVQTSLASLALARNERGPMSARNKSYTIEKTAEMNDPCSADVIKGAIWRNATTFLNPPIRNLGYKGILKTSVEIKKWFANSPDRQRDFCTTAMLMERAGTGGSLFRNLYRDFLHESGEALGSKPLLDGADAYAEIALLWREVAERFETAGKTEQMSYIEIASDILVDLSHKEYQTMEMLKEACQL